MPRNIHKMVCWAREVMGVQRCLKLTAFAEGIIARRALPSSLYASSIVGSKRRCPSTRLCNAQLHFTPFHEDMVGEYSASVRFIEYILQKKLPDVVCIYYNVSSIDNLVFWARLLAKLQSSALGGQFEDMWCERLPHCMLKPCLPFQCPHLQVRVRPRRCRLQDLTRLTPAQGSRCLHLPWGMCAAAPPPPVLSASVLTALAPHRSVHACTSAVNAKNNKSHDWHRVQLKSSILKEQIEDGSG